MQDSVWSAPYNLSSTSCFLFGRFLHHEWLLSSFTQNCQVTFCPFSYFSSSGLTEDPNNRLVRQLYFQCPRGHVTWSFPTSAIRITFKKSNSDRNFLACFKTSASSSGVNIYRETQQSLKLLVVLESLEKPGMLNDGKEHRTVVNTGASEIHCISSENGKATLFLEASSYNLGIVKQVMDLNYILEPLPSDQPEKKWEGKNWITHLLK